MTDEDAARQGRFKEEITARLAGADVDALRLGETDARLDAYVRAVCADPRGHNVWEQAAVWRFMGMVRRYGLRRQMVQAFFYFYETLKFPGKLGPQCYRLTPVQCFQFASIFGFWEGGRRVVREAVLFVPRKFSKTTSTAALAVWDLIFGESNAESYTGANSADQAKKCFDVIRDCVRWLDPYGKRFVVNEQIIKTVNRRRTAKAQCLTANARTKDGLNASTVIMDEFSQARDSELLTVLTTSMGVRENPLTVIITTASDKFEGPFFPMLKGYKALLMGEAEDDSVFAHLFEPDLGDDEGDVATWRKVHPHMGVTVSEDYYRAQWLKAERNGADELLAFRTKLLNVYTENVTRKWIPRELLEQISVPMEIVCDDEMMRCVMGIDLSRCDDLTAITTGMVTMGSGKYRLHTHYFFPEGALDNTPNGGLYRRWAELGHLTLIPGPVIDYGVIGDYVVSVCERVPVSRIGFDPYQAGDLANYLRARELHGLLWPVPQQHGYFTGPVQALQYAAHTGRLEINDNPMNLWCFSNVVLVEDSSMNVKPHKRSADEKIDGVITMLMAVRASLYFQTEV